MRVLSTRMLIVYEYEIKARPPLTYGNIIACNFCSSSSG